MAQINWGEDLNKFFNSDLKTVFKNIFKFPTTAVEKINNERAVQSVVFPICAWVLSYLLLLLINVLFLGTKTVWGDESMLSVMGFGLFLKMSLTGLLFPAFLTILTILFTAIKGKTDAEGALWHSGIHALNFTLVWLIYLLCGLIFTNPGTFIAIVLAVALLVYPISMGINLMRQYLHYADNEGCNSFSWWSAPAIVAGSLGLVIWIMSEMGSQMVPMEKMF